MGMYDQAREVARNAARLAGELCLTIRAEMLDYPDHMEKAGHEPVTLADYGAQAIILRHVAEHFPQDASLAEERAAEFDVLTTELQRERIIYHLRRVLNTRVSLDDIRRWLDHGRGSQSERVWTIDPIDGTKGFLRGDQFAIAIALLVRGQPVVAALACPLMAYNAGTGGTEGVIALAVRGEGATLEPLKGGASRPLRVSPQTDIHQARAVESVEGGHTDHTFSSQVLTLAGVGGRPLRIDSQAKYVAVADGRAEIYIRHSPTPSYRAKVWDHAAGALIVEEAGGRVTDLDGRPLDFSHGSRLEANHGILATNGAVHNRLLEAIWRVAARNEG